MNVRWGALIPLLVLALLAAAMWRGLGRDPTYVPSPLIGRPAPTLAAAGLDAATLEGEVTLVNFWGTWCPGCHEEHEQLMALARDGVRIVGVAFWDEPGAVRDWLAARGNPYLRLGLDREGRAAIDWGVYGAPETFVIDKRGVVRDKHVGALTPEVVATRLRPLLAALRAEAVP